jgi:hypothetical protein
VPFFRREKLHERLAREGGLSATGEPEPIHVGPPEPGVPGYHGVQRPRRWDAVVTVESAELRGDTAAFVVLPDGSLLLDEDAPGSAVEPIAEEIEQVLEPPYRVEAVRRSGDIWAAAARRMEVLELPDIDGDELSVTLHEGSRTVSIDGTPEFGGVPALERLAGERYDSYAAAATRLDGDLWEIRVTPL